MVAIKEAKIWRLSGGTNVLTVPKDFVDNGLLNYEDVYEVDIKKVKP